jgi:hypothetical protein
MALDSSFLILGHGNEDISVEFDKRKILNQGFTLVTLAKCGVSTQDKNVLPILNAFHDPDNDTLFAEPRRNKKELERLTHSEIHIYNPGDKYPELCMDLFAQFPSSNESYRYVIPSGVYKFPIRNNEVKVKHADTIRKTLEKYPPTRSEEEEAVANFMNYNAMEFEMELGELAAKFKTPFEIDSLGNFASSELIQDEYENSLLPTRSEVATYASDMYSMISNTHVSIEKVFERGGPGVYYYVICREPLNEYLGKNVVHSLRIVLNEKMLKNMLPNKFKELSHNERYNNLAVTKSLMPLFLPVDPTGKNSTLPFRPNYMPNKVRRIELLRSQSDAQQKRNTVKKKARRRGTRRR